MSVTCIIPAYNEAPRIGYVLERLLKVKNLDHIIVVDDGSTDSTAAVVSEFPEVQLVRHSHNMGKSESLQTGLKEIKTADILLFDADMNHFAPKELDYAITKFTESQTDTLLLRTTTDPWLQRLVRADLVLTGCRLLHTNDLKAILKMPVTRFQLEPAINDYYLRNKKKITWLPFSGLGPRKRAKYGAIGILLDLKMFYEFFSYKGFFGYLYDLVRFPNNQA